MSLITLTGFTGIVQITHPLALPNDVGVASSNCRPGTSDLRPWPQLSVLSLAANTVVAGAQSLYRFGRDLATDPLYWMTVPQKADVVRGAIGSDSTERTYYTDGVTPKWVDNVFGFGAAPYPNNPRTLGVAYPSTAPVVALSTAGTATTKETRVYVWTWVTDKGEESAPSPPSAYSALNPTDATYTITFNEAPPITFLDAYNTSLAWVGTMQYRRLYRTVTASNGTTAYELVAQLTNLANGYVYTDSVAANALGQIIPSLYWTPPPATLTGLTSMWNGMMAGFTGKTIWLCYPYVPYAWPRSYMLSVPETVVGLCVWQQNLLVLTDGRPYLVTGTDPTSVSMQPIDANYSCSNRRSICEIPAGAVWAAPEGLAYTGTRGSDMVTDLVFTKEQWQAFNPASMVTAYWGNYVIVFYNNGAPGGLVFDWSKANAVYPNKLKIKEVYPLNFGCDMAYRDTLSGNLYLLDGTARTISKWLGGAAGTASFTSKLFRQEAPTNFVWAQVRADAYPVTLTVIADGVTQVNALAVNSQSPVPLPSGFKARDWQVTVSTSSNVQAVYLATSMRELQRAK